MKAPGFGFLFTPSTSKVCSSYNRSLCDSRLSPKLPRIQLMQYVIYGIASFFFLYGIILLAEGFYTTSAVKELHSEFKTTICGRCISGMVCTNTSSPMAKPEFLLTALACARLQFVFLTYILGVAWLGVFGFSAVPVFLFYNMWSTCDTMRTSNLTNADSICVDVRQYGKAQSQRARGGRLVLPEIVSEVFFRALCKPGCPTSSSVETVYRSLERWRCFEVEVLLMSVF